MSDKVSQPKFLADSMLGTLAKKLRLLGLDTAYIRSSDSSEIRYLVRSQDRILLTRDMQLFRDLGEKAWLVHGDSVREELNSIAGKLSAVSCQLNPFSLCLDCNVPILSIDPSEAEGKVPPFILGSRNDFSNCPSCGKVFWEGTHRKRMEEEADWMRKVLCKENGQQNG